MNNTELNFSLNDTTKLRNLIIENPELPLLIFCGDDAYSGEYGYEQAYASDGEIQELILYNGRWLDKDDYEEELFNDLCEIEDYAHLSDEEYCNTIQRKVSETEFIKVITIYIG